MANIGGVRLQEFAPLKNKKYDQEEMNRLFVSVRDAAYEIIKRKGASYYAIGLGLLSIVEAVLGDYRSVLSISTLMTGHTESATSVSVSLLWLEKTELKKF